MAQYRSSVRIAGFTLVELIAVIVIASVFFITLSLRFPNNNTQMILAKNQVLSSLRYARQIALSRAQTDSSVSFILSSNLIDLREGSISVTLPDDVFPIVLPEGITVVQGAGIYIFDRLGNTTANTIRLSDGENLEDIVVSEGGYAY
ncbi:MAG: pilus assembly FimT family protein [Cellvibrionaceae bacterium]